MSFPTSPTVGDKYTVNNVEYEWNGAVWSKTPIILDSSNIGYDNSTSGLTATTVQGAIDEIDAMLTDKADVATIYTKDELDITINAIDSRVTGLESGFKPYNGAYGLNWDETNDKYIRTGNSNYTAIQSLMKRCVLNADGSVNYYLHPTDSTKKADGSPANLDGTDGNVMVEIPKFYYKYNYNTTNGVVHEHSISLTADPGYEVHPAFVRDGVELDYRYRAAYDGYVDGGVLKSISGVYPTTNETITTFRVYAQANGAGWHQLDWLLHEAITLLCIIEYGTMNIQAALGEGRTRLSGGSWVGGSYIGITGLSNLLGNGSGNVTYVGDADDVAADGSFMSYRGIENFYGNIWKFADGVLFSNNIPYVNQNPSTYDSTTLGADDVSTGVTMTASDGYTRNLGNSNKGLFPTSVSGGTSGAGTTDYFYANDVGELGIALVGGDADNGLSAGPLCLNASPVAAYVAVNIGGVVTR